VTRIQVLSASWRRITTDAGTDIELQMKSGRLTFRGYAAPGDVPMIVTQIAKLEGRRHD